MVAYPRHTGEMKGKRKELNNVINKFVFKTICPFFDGISLFSRYSSRNMWSSKYWKYMFYELGYTVPEPHK